MAQITIVSALDAVKTLIRVGNLEGAHRELVRLAKHGDAAIHIDQFAEFSLKLRKPDVIELLLSDALPHSLRVTALFRLADLYRQLGDRRNAFRRLMDLAKTCAESSASLRWVSTYCMQIGEFSFALEIRERLLRCTPQDFLLALEVVESLIPVNRKRAHSELKKILSAPDLPSAVWERASYLYESLGENDAALQVIRKAVALRDSTLGARHRLAAVLWRNGQTRLARNELTTLLVEYRAEPNRLRMLGDLAFKLPDRLLAQQFAEAQYHCAPTDPECILYFAYHLRLAGDRSQAQRLLSTLFHAERRCPSMSDQQWVRLAEALAAVGDITLTKQAVAEAVAREPNSAKVRTIVATISLLEKSSKSVSPTVPRRVTFRQMWLDLFSRLCRIFHS